MQALEEGSYTEPSQYQYYGRYSPPCVLRSLAVKIAGMSFGAAEWCTLSAIVATNGIRANARRHGDGGLMGQ